jgi:hypothetical protein
MPKLHVAVNEGGSVLNISTDDTFATLWQQRRDEPHRQATEPRTVTRPVRGMLFTWVETLTVHTADLDVDKRELDAAYDEGYLNGEGAYYATRWPSMFLENVREAIESVKGSPDAVLCMLLATHNTWRYHYPTLTAVSQWLDAYECPDHLQCVLADLTGSIKRKAGPVSVDGIMESLTVMAALPDVDDRATVLDVDKAPSVLSALLANGQRLPPKIPSRLVPAEMMPAFQYLANDTHHTEVDERDVERNA